jgi:hypothetical protein
MKHTILFLAIAAAALSGCAWNEFDACSGGHHGHRHGHGKIYGGPPYGPAHDRPFPVGQVSDSFWETQQTNAEAADLSSSNKARTTRSPRSTPPAARRS